MANQRILTKNHTPQVTGYVSANYKPCQECQPHIIPGIPSSGSWLDVSVLGSESSSKTGVVAADVAAAAVMGADVPGSGTMDSNWNVSLGIELIMSHKDGAWQNRERIESAGTSVLAAGLKPDVLYQAPYQWTWTEMPPSIMHWPCFVQRKESDSATTLKLQLQTLHVFGFSSIFH